MYEAFLFSSIPMALAKLLDQLRAREYLLSEEQLNLMEKLLRNYSGNDSEMKQELLSVFTITDPGCYSNELLQQIQIAINKCTNISSLVDDLIRFYEFESELYLSKMGGAAPTRLQTLNDEL